MADKVGGKKKRSMGVKDHDDADYGQMNEPLRLRSLERIGDNEYRVQYYFRGHGLTCNGDSTIYLESSSQGTFIEKIVAHGRC